MARLTLEKYNNDRGTANASNYRCECCKTRLPSFALVDVADISVLKSKWACGDCITDANRAQAAATEASSKLPRSSWQSEYGFGLKAERNRLLDASRWTIMPDSPLSLACQLAFTNYLRTLQRMTVDALTTEGWKWPTLPSLEYPPVVVTVAVKK